MLDKYSSGMSFSTDVTQQSRSSRKRVSRELSRAAAEKTSDPWQAVINCLVYFAGGAVAVAVFVFAVALLRFCPGVPACAYSIDLPIGHFNQTMTSAPCPKIAGGAGSMEVPTKGQKCNMPAMNAC